MSEQVIQLYGGGDKRAEVLETAILNVIRSRGNGLPLPLVLGVLKLIEHRLIAEVEVS
jgi:hypothetical protein